MSTKLRVKIDTVEGKRPFSTNSHIRGTVHLSVPSATTLESIAVKLEGVAHSLVDVGERSRNRRGESRTAQGIHTDTHVFLYQSMIVFPPPEVREVLKAKSFTLAPGDYEYPFEFLLPDDTSCAPKSGITNKVEYTQGRVVFHQGNLGLSGFALRELSLALTAPIRKESLLEDSIHVKTSLPPSFELGPIAKVSYFVKATAKRASLFKVNLRSTEPFLYLPRQQILNVTDLLVARSQEIVGHGLSKGVRAHFQVRLPDPAHVYAGGKPTFKLFVAAQSGRRNESASPVYIQSICLSMSMITEVLARIADTSNNDEIEEYQLQERSSEIATRQYTNLKFDFSKGNDVLEVPRKYYDDFIIPKSTVPSFKVCNIERKYDLLFTVGISLEKVLNPADRFEVEKKIQYVTVDCPHVQIVRGCTIRDNGGTVPAYAGGNEGYPIEKGSAPNYNEKPSQSHSPRGDNPPGYSEVHP